MYLQLCVFLVLGVVFSAVQGNENVPGLTKLALIQLDDEPPVEICKCCYNSTLKSAARARKITIRPQGYNWLSNEPHISIQLASCTATNYFPGAPAPFDVRSNVLLRNGHLTAAGHAVKLELNRVGHEWTGTIQAFTNGYAFNSDTLAQRVNTYLSCEINYCVVLTAPSSIEGTRCQ